MSTYAIGDIQGCFQPFMRLLEKINFDAHQDTLWLTGDLVNRGPQSLKTLRFIKTYEKNITTVLGNHDLTLLAVANQTEPFNSVKHTFQDILEAPDKIELIEWLRHRPLIHFDRTLNFLLVHAGLHPAWDLDLALSLAKEVETTLQGPFFKQFIANMYGDEPRNWDNALTGDARLRFITNCMTRMRFCSSNGNLEFNTKSAMHLEHQDYLPWFAVPGRKNQELQIIFGHWAALEGKANTPNIFALDTGCVWNNCLTAVRLEDTQYFSVSCKSLT